MTISYNRLGSNGRLGNQMFQYAALRGIASNRGFNWLIPPPDNYGDSNYGLFDCFKMTSVKEENFGYLNARSVTTNQFHFSQEFFDKCPDNVNIHDYLTTEKYFTNIKNIIQEDYTFRDEILEPCKEIIDELDNPIFMHIRRGDYAANPNAHPICPIEYYEKALTHFDSDRPILIFSDDIEWCKKQPFFEDDRFMLSEFDEKYSQTCDTLFGRQQSLIPYYDLCMMTLCVGGIIANSTMSWWGAWLMKNRSQPIVYPTNWFGNDYDHYYMGDLFLDDWIGVEV